jgi:hypothetical protein
MEGKERERERKKHFSSNESGRGWIRIENLETLNTGFILVYNFTFTRQIGRKKNVFVYGNGNRKVCRKPKTPCSVSVFIEDWGVSL